MIPDNYLEQIESSAHETTNRAVEEIKARFPTEPAKALACVMAEIVISRAIDSLDSTQRKLVVAHTIAMDESLTKLGL